MWTVYTDVLDYLVVLDAYAMALRPRLSDTEILQFKRYDSGQAELVFGQLRARQAEEELSAAIAAQAFVYLVAGEWQLLSAGSVSDVWWVTEVARDQHFDFSPAPADPAPDSRSATEQMASVPSTEVFEVLEDLGGGASRYLVDELITPSNRADSAFLKDKWAMDYLYQNGVFGTFDA
ncbi:MAG: hypothetical protein AAF513_12465 [Pseudomonadota bacterium]